MAFTGAVTSFQLVASSWLNVALYTLELVLCGHYFARPSRPFLNKTGIAIMALADTVCTLSNFFEVSLAIGPTQQEFHYVVALVVKIITTYITAAVAQLSFCNLFYILTGNKLVSGVLIILIVVYLGFSWASGILLLKELDSIAFTTNIVGNVLCAATDLAVAVCLGWKFYKMMGDTMPEHGTKNVLRRILIFSVGSGAICATNTMTMLILLLENSALFYFLGTIQGRVYALSILANFLLGLSNRSRNTPTQRSRVWGFIRVLVVLSSKQQRCRAATMCFKWYQKRAEIGGGPNATHSQHLVFTINRPSRPDDPIHLSNLDLGSLNRKSQIPP
ncbi:hypothetical protein K438DRAFT_105113 [Mycena galopus ATCC 62051]|nr:hypothetical protein K438DRAFT_105113 [Mycena galopus ATCC 62051]